MQKNAPAFHMKKFVCIESEEIHCLPCLTVNIV